MKKLVTLLLVLACCVGTANAKTIYLVNNWSKTNIKIHLWGGTNPAPTSWPGNALTKTDNVDGYDVYTVDLGDNTGFILNYTSTDSNTQTHDLNANDYEDGYYYEFLWNGESTESNKTELKEVTVYTYNINVTTADSWDNLYIWAWNPSTTASLLSDSWPGKKLTGTDNVYSITLKSYLSDGISLLFDNGDGNPQTADLSAIVGDNNYFIGSMASSKHHDSWGEIVKTNAAGYATYVTTNPLAIPTGIAFCAEDSGTGSAVAHSVTNPQDNTPMIIKGGVSTSYHFATTDSGSPLGFTNAFYAGSGSALGANDGNGYNYILKGDAFYLANGNTVATNKAYLKLSQAATAKALIFMEDEETDGIMSVNNSTVNGEAYNLAGQRVAKDYKGIVIKNGKKYMNK